MALEIQVLACARHENMINGISNGNTDKYPPHSSSVWKAMYSLCEVEKGIYQTDTIKHWFKTQEFPVQRYLLTFMTYSKITITPSKLVLSTC